jgi:dihydroflavonol-4-reductase
VRPGEVYGPDDRDHVTCGTLIDFARSWPVVICRGGVSIVHVDDVADGILRVFAAARPPGARYLLAGESLSLRQLASLSIELLGRRAPIVTVPRPLLRAATRAAARLGIPVPWNAKAVPYATRFWFVDARRSAAQLGMSFRSARDTLAPTLAWLVATGRARQPGRPRRAQLGASGGPLNTGNAG